MRARQRPRRSGLPYAPRASPARPEPAACTPSSTPAAPPVPLTVVTSRDPKTTPVPAKQHSSGASPRHGSRPAALPAPGAGPRPSPASTKASVPPRSSPAAVSSPAAGVRDVASSTASTGPRVKQSSSMTCSRAFAAPFSREPPGFGRAASDARSRRAQRARAIAPVFGAQPRSAYVAKYVHTGAPYRTHSTSPSSPSAASAAAHGATRRCPCRSVSRAVHGPASAVASSPAADTAPASPYEPCARATSSTVLTPHIAEGSRATAPAAVERRAEGRASRAR
ncbi:hypothetical protein GTW68_16830 [Streptomyces sp. SID4945]|nr:MULTISPECIES: hypothetical protein [unclassified Streptomyces]MYR27859.1 hypothetical protein [Streptomyces sp. SID4945]